MDIYEKLYKKYKKKYLQLKNNLGGAASIETPKKEEKKVEKLEIDLKTIKGELKSLDDSPYVKHTFFEKLKEKKKREIEAIEREIEREIELIKYFETVKTIIEELHKKKINYYGVMKTTFLYMLYFKSDEIVISQINLINSCLQVPRTNFIDNINYPWAGILKFNGMEKLSNKIGELVTSEQLEISEYCPILHPGSGYGINTRLLFNNGDSIKHVKRWDIDEKIREIFNDVDIVSKSSINNYLQEYIKLVKSQYEPARSFAKNVRDQATEKFAPNSLLYLEWPESSNDEPYVIPMLELLNPKFLLVHVLIDTSKITEDFTTNVEVEEYITGPIVMKDESLPYILDKYDNITPLDWLGGLKVYEDADESYPKQLLTKGASPIFNIDTYITEIIMLLQRKNDK